MTPTLLCIATYRKGDEFLRECRRQGCRVLLLTDEKLAGSDWPREAIDDTFYIRRAMSDHDIRKGAAFLARTQRLDHIVALDDFDVEMAAMLREYLNVPGMGQTVARGFRDKLAMRTRARAAGIPVPAFVHALHHETVAEWTRTHAAPWVLKPRSQAAAIGIRKIASAEELWRTLEGLGDTQADFLLEQFLPGDVYHVDSIVFDGRLRFAKASRYRMPPMAVAHEGGIFVTSTLRDDDPRTVALRELNDRVLTSFGLVRGASHTEFIHAHDGRWYFLETSARVGGAYIVDVVEAASGLNLWREWARAETAGDGGYDVPPDRGWEAGIVLSLARQEWPDLSAYQDAEIVNRIKRLHHAGLVVASAYGGRVPQLLDEYVARFQTDFHASAPPPDRPVD
ncbi:MAG: ATP-grasp domain-containing protein [Vicinamibacterales bacterium]